MVRGQDEQPQSLAVHQGVTRRARQAAALEQVPEHDQEQLEWQLAPVRRRLGSGSREGTRAGQPLEAEASMVLKPGPAATAGLEGSRRQPLMAPLPPAATRDHRPPNLVSHVPILTSPSPVS